VSDLLDAAAAALGTPASLIQRSAAARAAANGSSTDDVLSAWAGGAPVAVPPAPKTEAVAEVVAEAAPAPQESSVAVAEPYAVTLGTSMTGFFSEPIVAEPAEPLEPVPWRSRVRTAVRVGAWTGAGLGLIGFLIAGAFWAPSVIVLPDGGPPVAQVQPPSVLIGVALVSVLFGAVVAALSRAAASWRDPAMQLSGSRTATGWIGAMIGLVLGVAAGSLLTGMGTAIEGSEEGLIQLPILPTLGVMLVGGAVLGAITAALPQLLGTPVAVDADDLEEVTKVRKRLGDAISIPLAGLILLGVLVLPFAYTLIQSNHLAANSAAVVAIITAGGILGFAALAGSKPNMRISFGELMVAVIGIGTVLLILLAVLVFRAPDGEHVEPPAGAVVTRVV
jgi:MFS family permease